MFVKLHKKEGKYNKQHLIKCHLLKEVNGLNPPIQTLSLTLSSRRPEDLNCWKTQWMMRHVGITLKYWTALIIHWLLCMFCSDIIFSNIFTQAIFSYLVSLKNIQYFLFNTCFKIIFKIMISTKSKNCFWQLIMRYDMLNAMSKNMTS